MSANSHGILPGTPFGVQHVVPKKAVGCLLTNASDINQAHGGKSFRIMAVDIQTIRDGKIVQTYHLENWLSALGQLRAK
jgi:hypothetical protein